MRRIVAAVALIAAGLVNPASAKTARWSAQKANDLYAKQPGLVGNNFVPKSAINQPEMWQEATFDPREIDRELGRAETSIASATAPTRSGTYAGRST